MKVKYQSEVNAYLKCKNYLIPLQPISYRARGSSAVSFRNDFWRVENMWNNFKKKENIKGNYKAQSIKYDDQMNIRLVYDKEPSLDVFYVTCGHPKGNVPKNIANLFNLMEKGNVCAPISANDPRVILVDKTKDKF